MSRGGKAPAVWNQIAESSVISFLNHHPEHHHGVVWRTMLLSMAKLLVHDKSIEYLPFFWAILQGNIRVSAI
jgi:hypothetical protein